MERQQILPADMHAHPRPPEREIYRREASGAHLARPMTGGDLNE